MSRNGKRAVYLVDGVRTPFLRATGVPGPFPAAALAQRVLAALMKRADVPKEALDEVVMGCVLPGPAEVNIARVALLRAGLDKATPALTVNRVCGSGMQAIDTGARNIMLGESDVVIAGGVESMSHAPVMLNRGMQTFLALLRRARTRREKLKVLASFRPAYLKPVESMWCALSDAVVNMKMGDTAEVLARKFAISREEMDAFALRSHRRAARAWEAGHFDGEVVPIVDEEGRTHERDNGIRADTSMEKLARLKPAFDAQGAVTAGNSSQLTDGACAVLLMSEEAIKRFQVEPLARIESCAWAGLQPREMGLGPAHAMAKLLPRLGLELSDIDLFEINEAFAAQVLAVLRALADERYCRDVLGLQGAMGEIDAERLNVDGGAIALGHPLGASGARIVLHLARAMARKSASAGVASLCIGGGQGGAMLLRR